MDGIRALEALAALAHPTRLDAWRLLVQSEPGGLLAGEIAERLGVLQNTMSGHLAILVQAGLACARREGRAVRYGLEVEAVRGLFAFLMDDCCGGRSELCDLARPRDALPFEKLWAAGRRFNVLFLCTHNAARSIMAEAIMNHDHASRFRAFSAGSAAAGEVSADALDLLGRLGYPTEGLRSKSWDEFATPDAPRMDFVFTVCDDAAAEICPVWPGAPMSAHWGVPDPRAVRGDATTRRLAHVEAFRMLERRIGVFASLPFAALERTALRRRLDQIGQDLTGHDLTGHDRTGPAVAAGSDPNRP
ncbi:MAG TPA: metalloregulator ArsR/SmtB family transcription factor [Thermohalobaculum sp.]|nr:metalloregulator ArsR/SmtB family transcription factor [Thermohalobaculum sp.]